MKTADLTGAALDWAVAKCEGFDYFNHQNLARITTSAHSWEPSTNWAQGGPIIERERVGVWPSDSIEGMWAARPDYEVYPERLPPNYGPTPLIAAMRCYVASKLGDEVEIPHELTKGESK